MNNDAMNNIVISSLAERPDLIDVFDDFPGSWPEFMYHDPITNMLYDALISAHPESNLIAVDPDDPARPIARACSFPFHWSGNPDDGLPSGGYDHAILSHGLDLAIGRKPTEIAVALEVTIRPDRRGGGLSQVMLDALRRTLAGLGYRSLIAPVRPNRKHLRPYEPMNAYIARTRSDGLPEDPWLRTHVRAGATIVGVAPISMTISAPLADWREWTGLPFDADGPITVPDALAPVHCDTAAGIATYVEPNVWMHHKLGDALAPRP
jgi:GNAT superfamily N-acetyltransferase